VFTFDWLFNFDLIIIAQTQKKDFLVNKLF
jgi:hypothetical protein